MVFLKGKINGVKGKEIKNNFIATMIFTEWYTTLDGYHNSTKRNSLDWRVDPTNIVFSPKLC